MQSKLGDILRRTLGLKKKPLEWIEGRKKKKEFVSNLAVKYLKSDILFYGVQALLRIIEADRVYPFYVFFYFF